MNNHHTMQRLTGDTTGGSGVEVGVRFGSTKVKYCTVLDYVLRIVGEGLYEAF